MTTIKSLLIALCILCNLSARATVADSNTAFMFAQGQLTAMLQGEHTLSYEEAIYQIENAWWGGSLDYVSYQTVLGYHTANIRLLMEEIRTGNKAPVLAADITETIAQRQARYNNLLANYAIYTYLTQPSLWVHGQKIYYNPAVSYATADPMGTADWTNTHVSRLLNEGTGNCFALASLYKILADRVGAEAELCTAPGHIYIRHADEHGHMHNVELGGRNFPGMGSIEAVTYTTPEAVKNGIAMRTLSKQQQVALALVYMAKGREYRQGADAGFALACAATALQYDSLNLNAMLLKAEAMEAALLAGGETIEELRGTEQYKEYEQWLGHIYNLGYREMPLQMKNLLVQGWTRDTITKLAEVQYTQAEKAAENTGGDTRYGSSSWGLFNEDIRTQTTERIGRSIYNTKTSTIEGFTTDEQLYNHYNFDPVVFAWNMDPKTVLGINPYEVFGNNPVLCIDPLGDIVKFSNNYVYTKNGSRTYGTLNTQEMAGVQREWKSAMRMLRTHGFGDLVDYIESDKIIITVMTARDIQNSFVGMNNVLNYNFRGGIKTTNGQSLSPITVLVHELDHLIHAQQYPVEHERLRQTKEYMDPSVGMYDNLEEKRVITGSEQEAALKFGDIKAGQVTRTDHEGDVFETNDLNSNKERNLRDYIGVGIGEDMPVQKKESPTKSNTQKIGVQTGSGVLYDY